MQIKMYFSAKNRLPFYYRMYLYELGCLHKCFLLTIAFCFVVEDLEVWGLKILHKKGHP